MLELGEVRTRSRAHAEQHRRDGIDRQRGQPAAGFKAPGGERGDAQAGEPGPQILQKQAVELALGFGGVEVDLQAGEGGPVGELGDPIGGHPTLLGVERGVASGLDADDSPHEGFRLDFHRDRARMRANLASFEPDRADQDGDFGFARSKKA